MQTGFTVKIILILSAKLQVVEIFVIFVKIFILQFKKIRRAYDLYSSSFDLQKGELLLEKASKALLLLLMLFLLLTSVSIKNRQIENETHTHSKTVSLSYLFQFTVGQLVFEVLFGLFSDYFLEHRESSFVCVVLEQSLVENIKKDEVELLIIGKWFNVSDDKSLAAA